MQGKYESIHESMYYDREIYLYRITDVSAELKLKRRNEDADGGTHMVTNAGRDGETERNRKSKRRGDRVDDK